MATQDQKRFSCDWADKLESTFSSADIRLGFNSGCLICTHVLHRLVEQMVLD